MKHPTQKIVNDRFVRNEIVNYLIENGGIDLNDIAIMDFSIEDREQLAQLIGYSLSGYSELSYVSDYSYQTSVKIGNGESEKDAKTHYLERKLKDTRDIVRKLTSTLFRICEEDLEE